jgi:hypothetical protein
MLSRLPAHEASPLGVCVLVIGWRGEAQIAEERSDEVGVCDLGAGPAVTNVYDAS